MNKLTNLPFYLLLIVTLVLGSSFLKAKTLNLVEPESVGMSSERLARISPVMQKYIDEELTPGVVTAVMRQGKLVHLETQGYMDVEAKKPMSEDAIFRIASMTKPIASVALMMLWEEGHFQLNDPVHKFIPSFKDVMVSTTSDASGKTGELVKPNRPILIRDMLTHTAGLANSYIGNTKAYRKAMSVPRPQSNAEQINRLSQIPLNGSNKKLRVEYAPICFFF